MTARKCLEVTAPAIGSDFLLTIPAVLLLSSHLLPRYPRCSIPFGMPYLNLMDLLPVPLNPSSGCVVPCMQKATPDLPSRFGHTLRVQPLRKGDCLARVLPSDSFVAAILGYPF